MSTIQRTTLAAAAIGLALPVASWADQQTRPAEPAQLVSQQSTANARQAAQLRSRSGPKWEIEGHGGWFGASAVTSGTAIETFARGATIPSLLGGTSSRAVSSWFFGDGPVLLAEVYSLSGRSARIAPLDSLLKKPLASREGGSSFGFRASRQLTPRFSAELNFDHVSSSLVLANGVEDALQATRASFPTVFLQLFPGGDVNSALTIEGGGDYSQQFVTGAVNFHFGTFDRVAPYATAGLGSVFNHGDAPVATLAGNYRWSPIAQVVWDETDTVTVHAVPKAHALVGVFGGGVRILVSPRHGVRADVRLHLSENLIDTTVDASPARGPGGIASAIFIIGTNPALQVASGPSIPLRSSLSGPAVSGLETFTASGTQLQLNFSVGYFFRF